MSNNIKTLACDKKFIVDSAEKADTLIHKTTSALKLQFAGRNNGTYFFGIPQYPVFTIMIKPSKESMLVGIKDARMNYDYEPVKIEHGAFIEPKYFYKYIIGTIKQYVIVGRIMENHKVTKYVCCNMYGDNEVIPYGDIITFIGQGKILNATIHKSTDAYGRYIEAVKGIKGTNLSSLPVMNTM